MKSSSMEQIRSNRRLTPLVNNLSPAVQLVEFAERYHVDEIIIGAPKRTRVGKLLFGSTAQYIVLNAPCPVVTVN